MRNLFRSIFESALGLITDQEFTEILDLVTSDIKVNRVGFGHKTSLKEAIEIAGSCFMALQKGVA